MSWRSERGDDVSYVYAFQVIGALGRMPSEPEILDWYSDQGNAARRGELAAQNVGHGATCRVLRRALGPWEVVS